MSDLLQTDSHAYRTCILYESLHEQPVEEAYQRMKKVMPNIDYMDFEYWYFRFLNGNYDLNHDKSSDPKTREFSDLSIDVVEHIVGNLGLVDKLSTRKVCRELRAVIDNQKSIFGNVCMKITAEVCEIQFEKRGILYAKRDHLEMALKDLSTVTTNPNWKLKNLSFYFAVNSDKAVLLLDSILTNHHIHVEHIRIQEPTLKAMVTLLPRLQPNVLESINFEFGENRRKDYMKKIMEMDQWKNARKLKLSNLPDWFSIENLFRFTDFTIGELDITDDRLVKIRDILFKTPTFEFCSLSAYSEEPFPPEGYETEEDNELDDLEYSIEEVMKHHAAYDDSNKQYRISKDHYFQMSLGRKNDSLRFKIEKKKWN
ncbi:unnamed protein product [Caenorhabditis brenneri]